MFTKYSISRIKSCLGLAAFLSVVILGQINAMQKPDMPSSGPTSKETESCFASINTMQSFNRNKIPLIKSTNLYCLEKLLSGYKTEARCPKNIAPLCKALLQKDMESAKVLLNGCTDKDFLDTLKVWNYLGLDSKIFEIFRKTVAKRLAKQGIGLLEEHATLLLKFKTTHLKSLAHQTLSKVLKSAEQSGETITLNEELTKLFNSLPDTLQCKLIKTDSVIVYPTPLITQKTTQLKKWWAKNGGTKGIEDGLNFLLKNQSLLCTVGAGIAFVLILNATLVD